MSELQKYLLATVFLFFFFGLLAFLSQWIPLLIEKRLGL